VRGRVVEFDEHRGWGAIEADSGIRYEFHCTQIADGTRRVALDAVVEFELRWGDRGRTEATAITVTG
jgi:CspA family cold shock protein